MSGETDPGPSVTARALALLEIVASAEAPMTLAELTAAMGLSKATVHRFAVQLERLGFLSRELDGRRWTVGPRFSAMALAALSHAAERSAQRAILVGLVAEIGETCNVTVRDGTELVYLDRVESAWPIQIRLGIGSRVPMHCTASGKLFLALTPDPARGALLRAAPLARHTPATITDPDRLEVALARIAETRIGTDEEEFIDGMAAAAVPVLDRRGRICATVAVHGPVTRLPLARAVELVPALRRAATRLAATYLTDG